LADFQIRIGEIYLNGVIDAFGDRAANVGGRFYYREWVLVHERAHTQKYSNKSTWENEAGRLGQKTLTNAVEARKPRQQSFSFVVM
jgi:hypothetical protein